MKEALAPGRDAEPALLADEFDAAIIEWSIDELDRSADLNSLRSAWTATDDASE